MLQVAKQHKILGLYFQKDKLSRFQKQRKKKRMTLQKINTLEAANTSKSTSMITIYVNEFTEATAKHFFEELNKARENKQEIVPVIIDSYGGHADSLMTMIDSIIAFPGKIATICVGKAMSCGCFLLGFGTPGYRYTAPNSRIMFHQILSGSWGTLAEIETSTKELRRLNNHLMKLYAKHCGHPQNYFLNLIKEEKNMDFYMTPEGAKVHKIIDHIKFPVIKTETITKIKIE